MIILLLMWDLCSNQGIAEYKLSWGYESGRYSDNIFIEHPFNSYELEIDTTNKELLAYALKQQGKLEEAMSIYENLYYSGNRNVTVVNNLANIYVIYDESARAESLYTKIINEYPETPFAKNATENLVLLKPSISVQMK